MSADYSTIPASALRQSKPFIVHHTDEQLRDFKIDIESAKLGPTTYENLQQDRKYGVTAQWLREAVVAWKTFNWRKIEGEVNRFPNFTAEVDDNGVLYTIHFMALFSNRDDAVPVLALHGWPGSFLEFLPIFSRLSVKYSPQELPYHIIVPSLPGYACSSAPPLERDFRVENAASILDSLMVQLGFGNGYIVQGGDVGSKIARVLGGTFPRAKVIHLNFSIMPDPENIDESVYDDLEREGLKRTEWFTKFGSAYALLHATKPATIGLALSASPVSLLAWIGDRFLDWTDDDLPLDAVLESVSLYWLTQCISTSLWPYRQLFTPGNIGAHENPVWHIDKPLGMSWFPKEIAWTATTGGLVLFKKHDKGGHFAAMEHPDVLLADLEEFIQIVKALI
ncbi:epoxide hydrolase [Fusarium mundagurra]|uniref:Epoxide hydrolase n=1 Tax=Fusarium mundagurra TaxID=1567541 RepID=A0A8H5Y7U7_9HYPO|nr:epoxide hydrolase [Fusarium mundagurra]